MELSIPEAIRQPPVFAIELHLILQIALRFLVNPQVLAAVALAIQQFRVQLLDYLQVLHIILKQ